MKKFVLVLFAIVLSVFSSGCEDDCCQVVVDKNSTTPVLSVPTTSEDPMPGSKPGVDEPTDYNLTISEPDICTIVNTKTKFLGHLPQDEDLEKAFASVTEANQTTVWNVSLEEIYGDIESKEIVCKSFSNTTCCLYQLVDQNCNMGVEVRRGAD